MEYLVVCAIALAASALTLFSGFGLGTILMPAFALFFPVDVAVAATAVVHLLNNLFKFWLVGRRAEWRVALAFGLPGAALAVVGAWVLTRVAGMPAIFHYTVCGRSFEITPVNLVIAILILIFAVLEMAPAVEGWKIDRRYIPLGGAMAGFFGGISGHQGALRAAFLAKADLSAAAFIATNIVCAVMVDIARLAVYGASAVGGRFLEIARQGEAPLVVAATLAAFAGAWLGSRYMKRVTMRQVRYLVGVLLIGISIGLGTGLI